MDDEKVFVPYDEAVKRLPDSPEIHTFRQSIANVLIGADWPRDDILSTLSAHAHAIEETGPMAQHMNHGLAIHDDRGALFIETRGR
jgi:hypothetical protein